jgi:hypothetical protein
MGSADFMLTAEELRLRSRKRRRLLFILLLLVLVLVLGFFTARPARNSIKAWQARRHAAKAFALIEEQKWTDAKNAAVAAYQLRPTEPQALRAVARFMSRTRQPDALEYWKQLADRQSLTREDRRDEAAVAILAGDARRADDAVRELTATKPEPNDWLLAAQLAIQKGVNEEAFAALDKVDLGATEQQQFQAALLRLGAARGAADEEKMNDARSRLEKLARGQSETALNALGLLAQHLIGLPRDAPHPFALTTEEIRHALETHPLAKAPHQLLALDLLERVDPARRDENVAQAIAQWKDGDASELLALATWLNGKGEFDRELETVPLPKALQSRELFLQHVDALGALGRWSDIKQLLDAERFPLDPVVQRMYLARCNAQLGEKTAAENNWKRALEAASGEAGKLLMLAEYAQKNGVFDVANSAYEAAAQAAPKLRVAQQGRLRLAQQSGDTKKIHTVLAEMLQLWPNDEAVQNDEAHLRLLLLSHNAQRTTLNAQRSTSAEPITDNEELITLEALAQRLVERNPRSLPHRTVLALARLWQNRAADALAVYENVQVAQGAVTPSALAVHAAVLAANGRTDEAKAEAAQIPADRLLPEERALIESLRD